MHGLQWPINSARIVERRVQAPAGVVRDVAVPQAQANARAARRQPFRRHGKRRGPRHGPELRALPLQINP